jgi:hypothetical protein
LLKFSFYVHPIYDKDNEEVINKSKFCGVDKTKSVEENCAVAIAIQDIFPHARVTASHIHPFGVDDKKNETLKIELPEIARNFIKVFDSLVAIPKVRLLLPEYEFVIEISDEVIKKINIDNVKKILEVKTYDQQIECCA